MESVIVRTFHRLMNPSCTRSTGRGRSCCRHLLRRRSSLCLVSLHSSSIGSSRVLRQLWVHGVRIWGVAHLLVMRMRHQGTGSEQIRSSWMSALCSRCSSVMRCIGMRLTSGGQLRLMMWRQEGKVLIELLLSSSGSRSILTMNQRLLGDKLCLLLRH